MSYDLRLTQRDGEAVTLTGVGHLRGGTYRLGSEREMESPAAFNVTYNYYPYLVRAFGTDRGLRSLYGLTASRSLVVLADALSRLDATETDPDYWKASEGNAWVALSSLLQMALAAVAQGYGDAEWDGD